MPGIGDTLHIEPKRHMIGNLKSWRNLLLERKDIDSAVYFNWYSMAWLLPAIMARINGYKVIIHAHNNKLHNCGIVQRILHAINRQIQKCMKITRLTNSELSSRFFFGTKPATMIFNAIDTDKFAFNLEARNHIRGKYGFDDNKHVYGFAGRIAFQKNPLFLMDVFKEIKSRDNNAVFLVCGDGDLLLDTIKRAEINSIEVSFAGSVQNIESYYSAMDVFILPSRFEGLGIVLIEAQCNGLPCVATADVIPEVAKVTDLLEFIPLRNNPQEWADKAIHVLNNSRDRLSFSAIVAASNYNIMTGASVLEKALKK